MSAAEDFLPENHFLSPIARASLERIGKTIPPWMPREGYRFSRSAALEMAKKLILVSSEDEATKLLQSDQAGKRAFWELANFLKAHSIAASASSVDETPQAMPYYHLCSWMIEQVGIVGRFWRKDTSPFSERYPD